MIEKNKIKMAKHIQVKDKKNVCLCYNITRLLVFILLSM